MLRPSSVARLNGSQVLAIGESFALARAAREVEQALDLGMPRNHVTVVADG